MKMIQSNASSNDIIQISLAFVGVIGVMAAWATAYLNWRSRPVLLATKEKHSRDLIGILENIKGEVSQVFPQDAPPFEDELADQPFPLLIEERVLYRDLSNHLPTELGIFNYIQVFKDIQRRLQNQRLAYYHTIKQYLETSTALNVLDNKKSNDPQFLGITDNCIRWLYTYIIALVRGNNPSSLQVSLTPTELMVHGSVFCKGTSSSLVDKLVEIDIRNINKAQPGSAEYNLLMQVKELIKIQDELTQIKKILLNQIDEAQSIPILPGDCIYIKRALKPLTSAMDDSADSPRVVHKSRIREFIESASLSVTFLALSIIIISSVDLIDNSFVDLIKSPNTFLLLLISALSAILFIYFSLALVFNRLMKFYDNTFTSRSVSSSIFISVLWSAIILGFIGFLFSASLKLPDLLSNIKVIIAIAWPAWVIFALIIMMIQLVLSKRRCHISSAFTK